MSKMTTYDMHSDLKSAKFALTQLTVEEFEKWWPGIEKMLDQVPHTWKHWTKDYIRASVEANTMQVWAVGPPPSATLIFFTQIGVYPADRVLHVTWGAGSFETGMIPVVEAALTNYAQQADCATVEIRGRPGWEPYFKSVGMKREYVTWSIDIAKARTH